MKRQCLMCRLGDDIQKVEIVELLRGHFGRVDDDHLRVRVPLCSKHETTTLEVVHVLTRES